HHQPGQLLATDRAISRSGTEPPTEIVYGCTGPVPNALATPRGAETGDFRQGQDFVDGRHLTQSVGSVVTHGPFSITAGDSDCEKGKLSEQAFQKEPHLSQLDQPRCRVAQLGKNLDRQSAIVFDAL